MYCFAYWLAVLCLCLLSFLTVSAGAALSFENAYAVTLTDSGDLNRYLPDPLDDFSGHWEFDGDSARIWKGDSERMGMLFAEDIRFGRGYMEFRYLDHDNGTMEMTATCCFELANKVVASASIDFLRPATAPTHGDDRVRVAGTEGVIEVTYGVVTLINADGVKELELLPERGIFYDFIRHLRYGEAAYTNAEETFELTRACLVTRNCADQASL